MARNDFYSEPENIIIALTAYLSIFSEGRGPNVPVVREGDGRINIKRTLGLPCYRYFPSDERLNWLTLGITVR